MKLYERIVSGEEMRSLDQSAIKDYGIPSLILMENAGLRAADIILEKSREQKWDGTFLIFAGKGNNGGDAFVVARHLLSQGKKLYLFLLAKPEAYQGDAKINLEILLHKKVQPIVLENLTLVEKCFEGKGPFFIVDGILGTGFKEPLQGLYSGLIELINKRSNYTLALDIPSGVVASTGKVASHCIRADCTVAFGFAKLAHYIAPAALYRGELKVVDISLPKRFQEEGRYLGLSKQNIRPLLQRRDRLGHKYNFGHSLLIGGSQGKVGAISLSAIACLRMGVGLVTASTWKDTWPILMEKVDDEIMTKALTLDDCKYCGEGTQQFSSIVIGPGLGVSSLSGALLKCMMESYSGPLVIDADALSLLAEPKLLDTLLKRKSPTVLTPHVGEMARLLKLSKEEVNRNPIGILKNAAKATKALVVLKGPTTYIFASESKVYLNYCPNEGMATGGSGDVLAGMIGGLLGQKMEPGAAVRLGVFLHSRSGLIAAKRLGPRSMVASDIVGSIGSAFQELEMD